MTTSTSITVLKGIGDKTAKLFEKAGIRTLDDLLGYFPRNYQTLEEPGVIADAVEGKPFAVLGFLDRELAVRYAGRYKIASGNICSGNDRIPVTWFNQPYLRSSLHPGVTYVFRGEAKKKGKNMTLVQPQIFRPEEYEQKRKSLQPVYPLVSGLSENMIAKAVRGALERCTDLKTDYLPLGIREKYQLAEYNFAIHQIHLPDDMHALQIARKRLVFDEFLLFILAVRQLKDAREDTVHSYTLEKVPLTDSVIAGLPYELTDAQEKVWRQVEQDMTKQQVMSRLVQGDVGSGKTIIAFLALLMAAENGFQGALMVPTEVLARQHFEAFTSLTGQQGVDCPCVLLTGSMKAKEKRETYAKIESGEAKVVIGTHALIQDKVIFDKLALVITDEQHRFGVKQREALAYKGELPHTIVMSATPIPRTLAVILYADLDVSVIDQMPVGRLPVKNAVVGIEWRPKAYQFIAKQVAMGHQAYVICPMVEESGLMEAANVVDYTETLRKALPPSIHVEYLHGKMKPAQKNEIMERFLKNEIQVLVSTTVVEVGVNVPNATVMMIEDANHFGLAQLHQLRGRVGRGKDQSYCIFVNTSDSEGALSRLDIMKHSNDGFEIARKDLELRGPGDLFGIRQSGLIDFKIADVLTDGNVMEMASEAAGEIMQEDAELCSEKYADLHTKLQLYTQNSTGDPNI